MRQYEADMWYDPDRRPFSRFPKGLLSLGDGVPGKAKKGDVVSNLCTPDITPAPADRARSDPALGLTDIRDLQESVAPPPHHGSQPRSGPAERMIEYHIPFDRCDREVDHGPAWPALDGCVRG